MINISKRLDKDYRTMPLRDLIKEYNDIQFNNDDWAIKRRYRITEELERRDIILDNDGNVINIDYSVEAAEEN